MSGGEEDDLNLLLSLPDRVLETPPHSPQPTDHGSPRRMAKADMSAFRDSVGDYLEDVPKITAKTPNHHPKKSTDVHVERFSGLRLRNLSITDEELNFSETRFIRLSAIRNSLVGDTISGCWATAGILTEKGAQKLSSTGKNYCIWKIGCLDDKIVSVFLFGDAYTKNCKETLGSVFALFNAKVRKDAQGFSLSVFSSAQISKMGTSVDYGVCKGKRKDGLACEMVINKSRGVYCNYHKSNASQKYSVTRTELKGGNLKTAFRDSHRPEGIYMFEPRADRSNNVGKQKQPIKLLSVDGLKKALSKAGKVTTNARSQGIRFLTEVTGKNGPSKERSTVSSKQIHSSEKKLSSPVVKLVTPNQPEAKRRKTEQQATEKMIEIEIFSSDGE
ncbi:hypothetical protein ACHQM5_024613 [Ranunculus cassubicifolius]